MQRIARVALLVVTVMGTVPMANSATPSQSELHLHTRSRVPAKGPDDADRYTTVDKTIDCEASRTA